MWKKWKIWDNVYKKSMLRAFARSRAKNGNENQIRNGNLKIVKKYHENNENRELRYVDEKTKVNSNQKLERNARNITEIEESQKKKLEIRVQLENGNENPIQKWK